MGGKPLAPTGGSDSMLESIQRTGVASGAPRAHGGIDDDSLRREVPLAHTTAALTLGPGAFAEQHGAQGLDAPMPDHAQDGSAPSPTPAAVEVTDSGAGGVADERAFGRAGSTLDPRGGLRTNAIRDLDAFLAAGAGREAAAGRPIRDSPAAVDAARVAAFAPTEEGASEQAHHLTQYGTMALSPRSAATAGPTTTITISEVLGGAGGGGGAGGAAERMPAAGAAGGGGSTFFSPGQRARLADSDNQDAVEPLHGRQGGV
jgi:hypothetical protein